MELREGWDYAEGESLFWAESARIWVRLWFRFVA